jgi:hypothetical protein
VYDEPGGLESRSPPSEKAGGNALQSISDFALLIDTHSRGGFNLETRTKQSRRRACGQDPILDLDLS